MGNITLDEHWTIWMDKIVKARVRLSRAEIVREGLKAIKFGLDRELEEFEEAKEHVKEVREAKEDDTL